jgi:hypothetical protein
MNKIFKILSLPARQGDCLWIEYGDRKHLRRLLIDGGTPETLDVLKSRILALPDSERCFELLVVTHVDCDHIGGVLKLLEAEIPGLKFKDIWFNGWRHLPGSAFEEFGPVQGEILSSWLDKPGRPWNQCFDQKSIAVPDTGPLPMRELDGALKLTLLSPTIDNLKALRPVWEEECRQAGLNPSEPPLPLPLSPPGLEAFGGDIESLAAVRFKPDTSPANGSSIALLAEFEERRILLAGDAYASTLLNSVSRLTEGGTSARLKIDAFKLPHHGSKANLSPDLLEKIECSRFLFSTNGAQFRHPDQEAVARIIRFSDQGAQLFFNYKTTYNKLWDNSAWKEQYGYQTKYAAAGEAGISLSL